MKTFDWNSPTFLAHRPEMQRLLLKYNATKMTEEEYIAKVKALKLPRTSPSVCKQNYRNLKENFGFFV